VNWQRLHPEPWDEETEEEYHRQFSNRIDQWLDAGEGSCVLRDHALAQIVAGAFHHFDGKRYDIVAFVVMPNHVHVLFRLRASHRLEEVIKSWKGFTAREINKRLGKQGSLWQEGYWDRMIRNERHFFKCREYIKKNPKRAKLRTGEYIL
jgi:type I restriction enzyme R subunit